MKQVRRFLVLIQLLAIVAIGCSRNPRARSEKFIKSGDGYFEQGKYAEAAIEYMNAVRADRTSAAAHQHLATAERNLGDWGTAKRELELTVELQPNNARAQLDLGNIELAAGDLQEAEQIVFRLLQNDSNNAGAHSLMANLDEAHGRHQDAISEIAKAISLEPNNAGLYVTRAVFESNAGQIDAAERSYQKAVQLDPREATATNNLAEVYIRAQRWADAEAILKQYIAVQPRSTSTRLQLSKVYLAQQRADAAEQTLIQAQKDMPDSAEAYSLLPEFYSAIGANDKALATFDSLHKQHPKDLKIATEYARLLFSMDQVEKASGINEQALAESRSDADALTLKGQILVRQGKPDAAISILRAVVNDQPTNAVAHYALGSAVSMSGDQNAAKDEWRRAAQLQPNMIQVQRILARVALAEHDADLLKQSSERIIANDPQAPDGYIYRALAEAFNKQDDKAEADLNKAIQVAPQNAMSFAKMAEWRLAHKRYTKAEKLYEQALERDPNYSDALQGLIAVYRQEKRTGRMWARVHEQITKVPNNGDFYLLLAILQEEKQDLVGAESSAQKAINVDPNNNNAFELLARVEAKGEALEKALANSYDWIKRNPKYARAYVLTGSLEESRANWKAAQELYRKAIGMQPHYADAENNLAYSMLENGGNTDVALSLAQSAHREAPNVATIDDTLAWAYYHKGLYKTAIGLLQDALKAEPQSALYHYHIGLAYGKINDRSQAKLHLQRALAIEPNSAHADLVRKQLQDLGS